MKDGTLSLCELLTNHDFAMSITVTETMLNHDMYDNAVSSVQSFAARFHTKFGLNMTVSTSQTFSDVSDSLVTSM